MKTFLTACTILLLTAACGQKGELYQPRDVPLPTIEQPAEQ